MENDAVKYVEKNYPLTAKAFKSIQHDQYVLFCQKQKDYGSKNLSMNGDLELEDDRKFAVTSVIIRMHDKMSRMVNLIKKQLIPENEPLEDAFTDISVYGVIAKIIEEGVWGK
tara:strand:- start:150 stop:488 length:339 start_codon:yes stop_codon:yes gene_type:complete